MGVRGVSFADFRNFAVLNITVSNGVNVFYGDNAQGKTNFLEGVYLLATGRSFKTNSDKELITFGKNKADLALLTENKPYAGVIELSLCKNKKKSICVNKTNIKRLGELYGVCPAVVFSPNDLSLIKGGPTERRRFLDVEICQANKIYYYNLKKYYHILRQRNALLKNFQRAGLADTSEVKKNLFIWNEPLCDAGRALIKERRRFSETVNIAAKEIYSNISGGETLNALYRPNTDEHNFSEKLEKTLDKDLKTGLTNAGPHYDDLLFLINDADLRFFGSQGQQKSAVLSLKLAVANIIKSKTDNMPVLLLDDCLSELDNARKKYLLSGISNAQVFITATGTDFLENAADKIFLVKNGAMAEV